MQLLARNSATCCCCKFTTSTSYLYHPEILTLNTAKHKFVVTPHHLLQNCPFRGSQLIRVVHAKFQSILSTSFHPCFPATAFCPRLWLPSSILQHPAQKDFRIIQRIKINVLSSSFMLSIMRRDLAGFTFSWGEKHSRQCCPEPILIQSLRDVRGPCFLTHFHGTLPGRETSHPELMADRWSNRCWTACSIFASSTEWWSFYDLVRLTIFYSLLALFSKTSNTG